MALQRIVVEKRAVADPSALGFAAFAATSYGASVHAAGKHCITDSDPPFEESINPLPLSYEHSIL